MKKISVVRGTAIVSILTLLSRVLGFCRDLLIARGFGSSIYADCFFVAFRIPNLLRSLVAEGALSSAFVPVFADAVKTGADRPKIVFSQILGFLLILSCTIAAVSVIFAEYIVKAFAPGFLNNQELFSLCIELTQYMLPLIICVSLVALINAALNTMGNFGAAAWAQIWMNLALIAGSIAALYYDSLSGVKILAWSALIGSIIQVLIQIPSLLKNSLGFKPDFRIFNSQVSLVIKLMLPAVLGATVYQLGIFLNTIIASFLNEGSVSWLYYADRIIQFPLGTFSIALGSVLLPVLALSYSNGEKDDFSDKTFLALGYTSYFILPLAIFIFCFAPQIVELLYQRGSFNSSDTEQTALAVQAYAAGLWSISSYGILARTFVARKDTMTATLVGVFSLLVNLLISLLMIGKLKSEAGLLYSMQEYLCLILPSWNLGHAGLAMASAVSSNISFLLLVFLSKNHLSNKWHTYNLTNWLSWLGSVITALIIFKSDMLGIPAGLLQIAVNLSAGICLYILITVLLKIPEALAIKKFLFHRLFKIA